MARKPKNEKPETIKELKFVRLRNSFEDLVGFVTCGDNCIFIDKPLRIDIETIFDEGRQILSLQEYLPQAVIELQEVEISMDDVLFVSPAKADFYEQYEYVADFFYNNTSKIKKPAKIVDPAETADVAEKVSKVVSILEAMSKKDKGPVH